MIPLFMGAAGFILYFLYDINSFRWNRRVVRTFFAAGSLLIGLATSLDFYKAWKAGAFQGGIDGVLLLSAAVSFAALIYCLFFALPFEKTYVEQKNGRTVYDGGVYALCRHPGVLCFAAMYLFSGLAALPEDLLLHGSIWSILNLVYAWFQDRVTFPRTFCNYESYQKRIPFLIPTKDSVYLALDSWSSLRNEEDDR